MAVLGATNLTGCNSIPDFIPGGTVASFAQAAAPSSWTRIVTDNADNRMLRVISSGSGGGVGGSASPILNNVVPAHTHGFTTGGISANHTHSGNTGNVSSDHVHESRNGTFTNRAGAATANATWTTTGNSGGISANHFHGFTTGNVSSDHAHSGSTDNGSSQTNWAPRYIDMLLCSKN
jgi:hypothetical protein